jgi:hypothetical protein
MTGYEFTKGPWQNVPWLLDQVRELFASKIEPKGGPTLLAKTAEVVVRLRAWESTEHLFKGRMEAVLEELVIVYVPKIMQPGPGILFPMLDVRDRYTLGRFAPMYELRIGNEIAKYIFLGKKADTIGPTWLGMSHATIELILDCRFAVLVEGPFDQLACRLIAPDVPVLSTGTKTFNEMHITHLLMLGVKVLHLMFDNDDAGEKAASYLARTWNAKLDGRMKVQVQQCPASDPSEALKREASAKQLRNRLQFLGQ